MSTAAARGGWMVAATVGAVEALKDQGVCRWNYVIRSAHQHAKAKVQTVLPPRPKGSSSVAGIVGNRVVRDVDRIKRTEKSMKKVMDVSCWGPSTVRF